MREESQNSWTRPKHRVGRERPHFRRPLAAQKFVGSLPPFRAFRTMCFGRVQESVQTVCNAGCTTSRAKEEEHLALLKAPSKQPKTPALQLQMEEDVRLNLDEYAEFIHANRSYVVSEALKLLFKKDAAFHLWLGQHTNPNSNQQNQGDSQPEIAKTA
jgi:hypothetical protein